MKKIWFMLVLLFGAILVFICMEGAATGENNEVAAVDDSVSYNGIDVSHHQKKIDWEILSMNKQIQYVYIKATEGATYTDPNFETNKNGAIKHNIKFGAYHYFRTTSTVEAQFENFVKSYPKEIAVLRPMVDVENCGGLSKDEIQMRVLELSGLMEKYYGVKPMIYSVNTTYNRYLATKFNDHILYIGRYGGEVPTIKGDTGDVKIIWQYSEKGIVGGIDKAVDLSVFWKNVGIEDLMIGE